MTLSAYVENIRNQIADAYNSRVEKYDGYVTEFEKLVATSGLPRATDFAAVKKFAKQRADILKQVGFPDDWKVSGQRRDEIIALLDNIPAEKAAVQEKGGPQPWYLKLSAQQIQECKGDPQLFVELSKMHSFEEQFNAASQAQAAKFGLPVVALDELPQAMAPMTEEHTISAEEVQWIIQKAKQSAAEIHRSDPRFADPYNTADFKARQLQMAERLGMSSKDLEKAQDGMTPEAWKQYAVGQGLMAA